MLVLTYYGILFCLKGLLGRISLISLKKWDAMSDGDASTKADTSCIEFIHLKVTTLFGCTSR